MYKVSSYSTDLEVRLSVVLPCKLQNISKLESHRHAMKYFFNIHWCLKMSSTRSCIISALEVYLFRGFLCQVSWLITYLAVLLSFRVCTVWLWRLITIFDDSKLSSIEVFDQLISTCDALVFILSSSLCSWDVCFLNVEDGDIVFNLDSLTLKDVMLAVSGDRDSFVYWRVSWSS